MYILVLFAIVMTGDPTRPVLPITRPDVGYYISEELCKADMKDQLTKFASILPEDSLMASKCVKVTGPQESGKPA